MDIVPLSIERYFVMKKPIILMISTYIVGFVILFGVIFSFNHVNTKLKNEFSQTSKIASDPELTKKFLSKVKLGQLSTEDYVELFTVNFEAEKAGIANTHSLIALNNSLKELLASVVILHLLLLTLFVKYNRKT